MRHTEAALAQWVIQEGRGLVVVVNKMDLLAGSEQARLRSLVMKAVPEEIQKLLPQVTGVPIVFVSALEGKGRAAVMRHVNESYRLWCVRLPTAKLNRWLRKVWHISSSANTFRLGVNNVRVCHSYHSVTANGCSSSLTI